MISEQQVMDAYKICGKAPDDGVFVDRNHCCPIGALVLAGPDPNWTGNTGQRYLEDVDYAAAKLNLTRFEVEGMVAGFDGRAYRDHVMDEPMYNLGVTLRRKLLSKHYLVSGGLH